MDISTAYDAITALSQADSDIVATQKTLDVPTNSNAVILNMYALTNNLLTEINSLLGGPLAGMDPAAPLDAPTVNQIKQIQTDIITDRGLLNNEITSANWTFGGIFDGIANEGANLLSQAEVGVTSGLKWLVIGAGILVAIIIFVKVA